MKTQTSIRFFFEHGMFSFHAQSPSELELKGAKYTLEGRAHLIKSTTLIVDSDNEMPIFQGQAKQIYDHLTCPKTYMLLPQQKVPGLIVRAVHYYFQLNVFLIGLIKLLALMNNSI